MGAREASLRRGGGAVIDADRRKKAAEEISAGTSMLAACSEPPPARDMTPLARFTWYPKPRSMRSVWSRVGAGSVTEVVPLAYSPASNTQDFTWALAMGRS